MDSWWRAEERDGWLERVGAGPLDVTALGAVDKLQGGGIIVEVLGCAYYGLCTVHEERGQQRDA